MLQMQRDIVFIAIQTTGVSTKWENVVEIACTILTPEKKKYNWTQRIKPSLKIPVGASDRHGIKEEDVADCPMFSQCVEVLKQILEGRDLCGWALLTFILPMLRTEFERAGSKLEIPDEINLISLDRFYDYLNPRNISTVIHQYLSQDVARYDGPAQTEAMSDLLPRMLEFHRLKETTQDVQNRCRREGDMDVRGHLQVSSDGEILLGINGMPSYAGRRLADIAEVDPCYLQSIVHNENYPKYFREYCAHYLTLALDKIFSKDK